MGLNILGLTFPSFDSASTKKIQQVRIGIISHIIQPSATFTQSSPIFTHTFYHLYPFVLQDLWECPFRFEARCTSSSISSSVIRFTVFCSTNLGSAHGLGSLHHFTRGSQGFQRKCHDFPRPPTYPKGTATPLEAPFRLSIARWLEGIVGWHPQGSRIACAAAVPRRLPLDAPSTWKATI